MRTFVPRCDYSDQFFPDKRPENRQHRQIFFIVNSSIKFIYPFLRVIGSFVFGKYLPYQRKRTFKIIF